MSTTGAGESPRESRGDLTLSRFPRGRTVRPFLVGTAIGGLTGAIAGTLLSQSTRRLLVGLIHVTTRRLTDDERDELRFELLLQ